MLVKLRSVLFYVGVIPVTMFFGVVGILILPLPRRWRYFVITRWSVFALFWLRVACVWRQGRAAALAAGSLIRLPAC